MLVTNRNVSRKLDYLLLLQIIVWSIYDFVSLILIGKWDYGMLISIGWRDYLIPNIIFVLLQFNTSTSSTWQQLWKWEGGVNLKKNPLITSFKKLWKKTKKSWKGAGPTFKWCERCWFRSILCTQWGTNPVVFPWITTPDLCFPNSQPLSTLFTLKLLKMYSKFSKL